VSANVKNREPQGKIAICKSRATAVTAPGFGRTNKEFDMSDVTWLPCPGASAYEVSSDGRLRSIDRIVTRSDGRQRFCPGVEMKLFPNPRYAHMQTRITFDDGARTCKVHVLICQAFYGRRPTPLHEVRHLNGNPSDNRIENLRWGTKSENMYDRVRHGNHAAAAKTHCVNGHPFDAENTGIARRGGKEFRQCRQCRNDRSAQRRIDRRERVLEIGRRADRKRRDANPELYRQRSLDSYHRNRQAILERRAHARAEKRSQREASK
jgi:hypothetical protein